MIRSIRRRPEGEHIPQRRLRPIHIVLGLALAGSILTTQGFVFVTEKAAAREAERLDAASLTVTNLANIQRESLRLAQEAVGLPTTRSFEKAGLYRSFVNQQVRRLDTVGDADIKSDFAVMHALLDRYDAEIARLKREGSFDVSNLRPILADLELLVKRAYDREEKSFFAATAASLNAGRRVQQMLFVVGLLVFAIGALLALSVRKSIRSDFEVAYRSLRTEFEERKAAEAALRASEERFRSLVQNSSDVVTVVDPSGTVLYVSPAADRLFGYAGETVTGTALINQVHPDDRDRVVASIRAWANGTATDASFEWRIRHVDGTWLHCETRATNLIADPNVGGIVLNTRDVSERKVLEDQLAHRAFHDPLTELANRALFRDRVEHALVGASRRRSPVALLFIDLDDFKRVNDTLGHATGDRLLEEVAARLRTCVRPTDTVARFGGDEFAILVEEASGGAAIAVADRILEELQEPMSIGGKALSVRASIGIVEGDPATESVDSLMRNADVAMYAVKSSGKGTYEIFRPALHAAVVHRMELESSLEHAAERGELVVHFQPIVELRGESLVGVEALVRWNHPTRGMIGPNDFIPLAEETGAIHAIGRHVLFETTKLAAQCSTRHPELAPRMVNVNVSAGQLESERFHDDVRAALEASGLDPQRLVLEMTEGALVQDSESIISKLHALKSLGVRLAIDDFGTGYSSLSYLRRLPVDILKVDKSFVERIVDGVEEVAFVGAIYRLARTLGLETVVEGVETPEQLTHLKAIGFEMGQGFLFAPPMACEEVSSMLDVAAASAALPPASRDRWPAGGALATADA